VQSGDLYYSITRTVNIKGKQTLEIGSAEDDTPGTVFAPVASVGLKDAQGWLETQLLKSSYLLFINSIAYTQDGTDNFVKQTAAKRKELLLEIVNTEDFELYYNRARTELANTSEKRIRLTTEITGLEGTIELTKESTLKVKEFEAELRQLEDNKQATENLIGQLRAEKDAFNEKTNKIKELNAQILTKKAYVEDKHKTITEKLGAIQDINNINITVLQNDVEKLHILQASKLQAEETFEADRQTQSRINELIASRSVPVDYTKELASINARLAALANDTSAFCETIGKECPKLLKEKTAEISRLESRAGDIAMEMFNSKKAQDLYDAKFLQLNTQLSRIPRTMIINLSQQIEVLKKSETELAVINIKKDRVIELDNECKKLEGEAHVISLEINGLEQKLSEELESFDKTTMNSLINSITEEEVVLADINNHINDINYKLGYERNAKGLFEEAVEKRKIKVKEHGELCVRERRLTLVKEAFGGKGLKNIIIDYVLPRLEGKINMILSKLSNFTVSLDTQKTGADGETIIEGLFINIFNERGEELSYESYSGGEKSRIVYSIFEALSSFQRCGFRLLDEHISGLNANMIDTFAKIMLHLDKQDTQVICISHLQEVKDQFPKIITIEKRGGVSQIV